MKTKYLYMALAAICLTACDRDDAEDVKFNVSVENTTVYAGEAVTFNFDGNPDYIVYYPGTKDCSYANHDRTSLTLDSIGISCRVDQYYADVQSYAGADKTIMHAYISTDYSGELTAEAIATATWTDISGYGENQLNMPVVTNNPTTVVNYTAVNLTAYLGQQFFIAFKYAAGPNNNASSNYGKPRVQVKDLTLAKREPDKYVFSMSDALNDWGFNTVQVKVAKENNTKYEVSKSELFFFPDKDTEKTKDVEVWMVSQKINPAIVQPDRGTPIKSTNAKLPSYQYTYNKPGTYTATFIATNANMWNSSRLTREVTVTVKEKPVE